MTHRFLRPSTLLPLSTMALSLLLVGCGGGLRTITPEIDDKQAIHSMSSFHVAPVEYDFERDPEWEIPDNEWPTKTQEWSSAFAQRAADADRKPVYALGAGSEAKEGATVEFVVTDMALGSYTVFYNQGAKVWGVMTIRDNASGDVIFKGSVYCMGGLSGTDRYSYEGRVKMAHIPVADDIRWLINRELE